LADLRRTIFFSEIRFKLRFLGFLGYFGVDYAPGVGVGAAPPPYRGLRGGKGLKTLFGL